MDQENKLKKMEAELARKAFLEDNKDKHIKRLFKHNENIRETVINLLNIEYFNPEKNSKYKEIHNDDYANEIISKLKKLTSNIGAATATVIEDD